MLMPSEFKPSGSTSLAPSLGEEYDSGFLLATPALTPPKKPRIRGEVTTFLVFPSSAGERTSLEWRD